MLVSTTNAYKHDYGPEFFISTNVVHVFFMYICFMTLFSIVIFDVI